MATKIYSTPGVYIEEKDAFSRSVVPVATAVPVFIGYTEKAILGKTSVNKQLVKIQGLEQYHTIFGKDFRQEYKVSIDNSTGEITVPPPTRPYYLYNSLRSLYANGGGDCYIYSIGPYGTALQASDFTDAMKALKNEPEPTIILAPDALTLGDKDQYYGIWSGGSGFLAHCKAMINRFAIIDVYGGQKVNNSLDSNVIKPYVVNHQEGLNGELAYGATYWPWVQATVVQPTELSFDNISNWKADIVSKIKEDVQNKLDAAGFDKYFPELPEPAISKALPAPTFTLNKAKQTLLVETIKNGLPEGTKIGKDASPAPKAQGFLTAAAKGKSLLSQDVTAADIDVTKFTKDTTTPDTVLDDPSILPTDKPYGDAFTKLSAIIEKYYDDGKPIEKYKAETIAFNSVSIAVIKKDNSVIPGFDETSSAALSTEFKNINSDLAAMLPAPNPTPEETREEKLAKQHNILMQISPLYKGIMKEVRNTANIMPPSGALAGVYTYVDNQIGTFKAPANVGLGAVAKPLLTINDHDQESLNIPINGKALNVIRSFPGRGTLVWGARTLDGNSQDWRYISVRRTVSMIELSVKYAAEAYVFEPNVSGTWTNIKAMISNFLNNMWHQGALAGSTAAEAYSVSVGLGSTMTGEDILDGYMRVEVKVAITRPAEFIVITFQQQMQTS